VFQNNTQEEIVIKFKVPLVLRANKSIELPKGMTIEEVI